MPVRTLSLVAAILLSAAPLIAADADLILYNGKIVTVDSAFSIAEAWPSKGRVVPSAARRRSGARTRPEDAGDRSQRSDGCCGPD